MEENGSVKVLTSLNSFYHNTPVLQTFLLAANSIMSVVFISRLHNCFSLQNCLYPNISFHINFLVQLRGRKVKIFDIFAYPFSMCKCLFLTIFIQCHSSASKTNMCETSTLILTKLLSHLPRIRNYIFGEILTILKAQINCGWR